MKSSDQSGATVRSVVAGVAALTGLFFILSLIPSSAFAGVQHGQWQLTALHASSVWRYATGAGVTVAVLDSGVDASHPDLAGQVLPGVDFVDGSTDGRTDFVGHGTTVAGLIAGVRRANGATGLAPQAKILPIRVLDRQNRYGDSSTVAKGVRWAVDHGAEVINLSLGGGARSGILAAAIAYAYQHDVVVVACTGNLESNQPRQIWYPAREPGVVAVSGVAETEQARGLSMWRGALTGTGTVLTAPAVDLLGAKPGGYWRVQGTSFAAPLVTATAALIRSRWPGLSAANVINRMITSADDLGAKGRDSVYGYGEVDPLAALTEQVPEVAANPLAPDVPGPSPRPASRRPALDGATPLGPAPSGTGPQLPAALSDRVPGLDWRRLAAGGAAVLVLLVGLLLLRRRFDRVRG